MFFNLLERCRMPNTFRFHGIEVAYVMGRVIPERWRNIVQVDFFPQYSPRFQGWSAIQCSTQLLVYPPNTEVGLSGSVPDITVPASLLVHQLVPVGFQSYDGELNFWGFVPEASEFQVETLGSGTRGYQASGTNDFVYVDLERRCITETTNTRFPYGVFSGEGTLFEASLTPNGERVFSGQYSITQHNPRIINF